jgi:hypothetical protein
MDASLYVQQESRVEGLKDLLHGPIRIIPKNPGLSLSRRFSETDHPRGRSRCSHLIRGQAQFPESPPFKGFNVEGLVNAVQGDLAGGIGDAKKGQYCREPSKTYSLSEAVHCATHQDGVPLKEDLLHIGDVGNSQVLRQLRPYLTCSAVRGASPA